MQHHLHSPSTLPAQDPLVPETLSSEDLGGWLRNLREHHGISLSALAAKMCTTQSVVASLENNEFERLGAPIYVIGHLRNYARFVGVPASDVITLYRRQYSSFTPTITPVKLIPRDRYASWLFAVMFYPIASGGFLWLAYQGIEQSKQPFGVTPEASTSLERPSSPERKAEDSDSALEAIADLSPSSDEIVDSPEAIALLPEALPAIVASLPQEATSSTTSESVAASPVTLRPPLLNSAIAPAHAAVNASSRNELVASGHKAEIVLAFSEACWLEVRDADDKRIAYGMQQANTVNTLQGKPPFAITLGNAQATRIVLNGETVDAQRFHPQRGSVSRFSLPFTD